MTLSRRASRRTAFFLLYQWDVTGQPLASLYEGEVDDFALETAEVLIAIGSVFLAVPVLLALIGVVRRAGWGLVMSWVSAVLLCLTCVGLVLGIPIMVFAARTRF